MTSLVTRFIKDESGATAIEYGLIAAGLAIVVLAIFGQGGQVNDFLDAVFARLMRSIPQ